jgi:hypothetical protein
VLIAKYGHIRYKIAVATETLIIDPSDLITEVYREQGIQLEGDPTAFDALARRLGRATIPEQRLILVGEREVYGPDNIPIRQPETAPFMPHVPRKEADQDIIVTLPYQGLDEEGLTHALAATMARDQLKARKHRLQTIGGGLLGLGVAANIGGGAFNNSIIGFAGDAADVTGLSVIALGLRQQARVPNLDEFAPPIRRVSL